MPKKVWFILIAMVINVVGSSFFWPFNTIYIHEYLGKSITVAGLVLMFNAIAALIGNLLGGKIFDKIGGYRSIMIGATISLVSSICLFFRHDFLFYSIFLVMLGMGSGIIFPSMYALIGNVWKEGRRKAFNALYVAVNVGVATAPALGGFVAAKSIEYLFIANTFFNVILFIMVLITFRNIEDGIEKVEVTKEKTKVTMTPQFVALLVVCLAFALCWFTYIQWQAPIATHVQEMVGIQGYSILWTINGALIVLGQPIISKVVKFFTKTYKQQMVFGIVIFIFSFIIANVADNFTMFIIAMVTLTFGEMFVWPAVPTIANQLAPPDKVGFYQGIVNGFSTGGKMFGPLIGGMIVDAFNLHVLFFVLYGVLIVAIGFTLIYDRKIDIEMEEQTEIVS